MPAAAASVSSADERHLCWLDWLRFLAAFIVMADHTRAFNWIEHARAHHDPHPLAWAVFVPLFSLGKQAVVLFFVLSGWLVGGHTIRKVRAGTFDAAAYAADRFSRVYVPLVPALLFTAAVVNVLDQYLPRARFVACLFAVQDVWVKTPDVNAPLWTLVYEVWFYVLAGCAAVACRSGRAGWQRVAGMAGAALAVGICCRLGWAYLVCWLLGAVGVWLRDRIAPALRPWTAGAGVIVMAAGTAIFQIDEHILPVPPADVAGLLPLASGAQLIVAIGALLLVASVVAMAPATDTARRIERAGVPLAAFSYTLYLTHYPTLWALNEWFGPLPPLLNGPSLLRAVAWVAVCCGVALGMYALFEARTPRVRRWLRARFAAVLGGGHPVTAAPLAANLLG